MNTASSALSATISSISPAIIALAGWAKISCGVRGMATSKSGRRGCRCRENLVRGRSRGPSASASRSGSLRVKVPVAVLHSGSGEQRVGYLDEVMHDLSSRQDVVDQRAGLPAVQNGMVQVALESLEWHEDAVPRRLDDRPGHRHLADDLALAGALTHRG